MADGTVEERIKKQMGIFISEHLPKTKHWDKALDYFINVKKDFFRVRDMIELSKWIDYIEEELGIYFTNISIPSSQIVSNSSDVSAS